MKKNILNLEGLTLISKKTQQSIHGGRSSGCPVFQPCWSYKDCPCEPCSAAINRFWIDDLSAFKKNMSYLCHIIHYGNKT